MSASNVDGGLHGPGFEGPWEIQIFLFSKTTRPALGTTQSLTQWIPGFIPGREVAGAWRRPLTSTSAKVKNEWSNTSTETLP
jgi:hypothetical protein